MITVGCSVANFFFILFFGSLNYFVFSQSNVWNPNGVYPVFLQTSYVSGINPLLTHSLPLSYPVRPLYFVPVADIPASEQEPLFCWNPAEGKEGVCTRRGECLSTSRKPVEISSPSDLWGLRSACVLYINKTTELGVCCVDEILEDGVNIKVPESSQVEFNVPQQYAQQPAYEKDNKGMSNTPHGSFKDEELWGLPFPFPGIPGLPTHLPSVTNQPLLTSSPRTTTVPTTATANDSASDATPVDALQEACNPALFYNSQPEEGFKVVGGTAAAHHAYPWLAAIFEGTKQFCGGSLIDSIHILTAAHCVATLTTNDVKKMFIRLGAHDLAKNENHAKNYKVDKIVRHKDYSPKLLYNDVAIITLAEPVTFSRYVRPICLIYFENLDGQNAFVAGWGSLFEGGPQPTALRQVALQIWTNGDCAITYGRAAPGGIVPSYICAGQLGKDSCSGDSGGPLVRLSNGVWKQVGIVSWGIGCGKSHFPGIYSRISTFLPWIRRVISIY